MHFDGTMSKKAGVSSIFPTSERGYFPILMNFAVSAWNLVRTLSSWLGSFWLTDVWLQRESLWRLKNFSIQPRLALNSGLPGCMRFFTFFWMAIIDTGKFKSRKTWSILSAGLLIRQDSSKVVQHLESSASLKELFYRLLDESWLFLEPWIHSS